MPTPVGNIRSNSAAIRTALFRAMKLKRSVATTQIPANIQGQQRLAQLFVSPNPNGQRLVVFLESQAPETSASRAEAGLDYTEVS